MPQGSSSNGYTIDSTGTNSQVSEPNRNLDISGIPTRLGDSPFPRTTIEIPDSWGQSHGPQSEFASREISFPSPMLRGGMLRKLGPPPRLSDDDGLNCFILLQGNHYCSRDYGNGSNSYHYSNQYVFPSPEALVRVHVSAGTAATTMQTRTEAHTTTTARGRQRTRPPPTAERTEAACLVRTNVFIYL